MKFSKKKWLVRLGLISLIGLSIAFFNACGGSDDDDYDDGFDPPTADHYDQLNYTTLKKVCRGVGVPGAGNYNRSIPGPHPVMLSYTSAYFNPPSGSAPTRDWWERLPNHWYYDHKESISNIELVACVSDDYDIIVGGPCAYNIGSDIYFAKHARDIVLRNARTAQVVARKTFEGSSPALNCPQTAPISQTREYGGYYSYEQVQGWLNPYVYP